MPRLLLVLVLAGCAAAVPSDAPQRRAEPVAVVLYRDTVTVRFSDRSLCTAARPGRSGAWTGTLSGCPHLWPVEVRRPVRRARLPLAPAASDPWVVLTGPGGPRGYAPQAAPSS